MSPSLEYLERCAAETGFQVAPLEKVIRLGELAADVARHPLLGGALALKGGTALNLCFGAPRRLSVDLDFDYVAAIHRGELQPELLFPDNRDEAARVAAHPAIQWKLQKVRARQVQGNKAPRSRRRNHLSGD